MQDFSRVPESGVRDTRQETQTQETQAQEPSGDEGRAPGADAGAVVPIPGFARQEPPRISFWRRIRRPPAFGSTGSIGDERVLARLDVIESRLTATDQSIQNRIQRLDDRFTEVWEVEEQLSQLHELQAIASDVRASQTELQRSLRRITRRLSLLTLLAAGGLVAAVVAVIIAV